VTGCSVGRRTLRIEDFGKIAATFVDTLKDRAVRIAPHSDARVRVVGFAPEAVDRWTAQLLGYQRMPDDLLLIWQWVKLTTPVAIIVGQDGQRTTCQHCHEEIINQREVARNGVILCRACAGSAYYQSVAPEIEGTRVTSPESPPLQGEGSIPPTPACP
ncbi:MAG TPA: TraR/DksA C4-type zinc finger protein, partial [Chloroflexota bacterium]|nr:TraR/DksA C4-type zinc finger protein [Chloroflexota bacterium]